MKISRKEWAGALLFAIIGFVLWYIFSYPQFSILNLTITKKDALSSATRFLNSSYNIDASAYFKAVTLEGDYWADVYLQRVLGFKKEEEFIKTHRYEFLYWSVRFFKENEKEEYNVLVSPSTGEVIGFSHLIEDTEVRPTADEASAKINAEEFLRRLYNIDFNEYIPHEKRVIKFDRRTDYEFFWEKKGVYIPWKKEPDSGGAKLLVKATISGNEVREFYEARLDIPEKFRRFVENNMYFGETLSSLSFLAVFFWLVASVVIIFKRKDDPRILKTFRFYIFIGLCFLMLGLFGQLNDLNHILSIYPTSSTFVSFFGLYLVSVLTGMIFMSLSFLIPGVAGEYLSYEVMPTKKRCSFFHYIRSTLFSRNVAGSIIFGYLLCVVLLGIQSVCIYLGNKYLGLWVEKIRLIQVSASFVPFYSAFLIGINAGFSEEIIFRLFGINWAKRYLKRTTLAVLLTSLIWGFGHTDYPIFPVWFRGIEVTILGIVYGVVYLRFGLIPLLVAHYLFDAYWGIASYIFGGSTAYLTSGSIFIMCLPAIFAFVCFILNRKDEQRPLKEALSPKQLYNSDILAAFIDKGLKEGLSLKTLEEELIKHGWDITLVRYVIENLND